MSIRTSFALVALVLAASPLAAQGRGHDGDRVPRGHLPPPGMCRIWIDGVPPGRQPEPTDCATARRHAPRNARVIYGDRTMASRDDDRRIDGSRRERDGRYEGDRKYEVERRDRKYEDRKIEDRSKGEVVFGKDDDHEISRKTENGKSQKSGGSDPDRKEPDRDDSTRKR